MSLFKKIKKGLKKVAGVALPAVGTMLGGPVGGLIGKVGAGLLTGSNAKSNAADAGQYAQQAAFTPTGISMPGLGVGYDAAGNYQGQITNPMNQMNAQSMIGASNTLWGNYLGAGNPLAQLQGAYGQSMQGLNGLPGMGGVNALGSNYQAQTQGIMGQLGQLGSTLQGQQFGDAANSILGSLGSFDPNQLAGSYADNLRQMARPGEQNAANALAQRLFNTGRLGSTGGQRMMGEMANQMEQADIARTVAGQQLAGQEQSRLGGLAGNLSGVQQGLTGAMAGLLGQQAGIGNQALGMAATLQGQDYNQMSSTTNQRFQNAMQLFGAGNTQQNQSMQGAFQAMGLGTSMGNMDVQNMLQAMQLSGQLSSARSGANANAYMPQLQANVAQNDTNASNMQGILGALGGLFQNPSGATPGITDPSIRQQLGQLNFTDYNTATNMAYSAPTINPFRAAQLGNLKLS